MTAPNQNTNAQRGETPRESHLHMRCEARQKALWTKAAQATGKKLTAWVEETLDRAAQRITNRKE